jgi:hypothetical protein
MDGQLEEEEVVSADPLDWWGISLDDIANSSSESSISMIWDETGFPRPRILTRSERLVFE